MLLLLSFLLNIVLAEPASTEPPVDPEALNTWWKAAGQLRMGDTAYRITQNVQFKDGVCDVNLSSGMVIPVYTGKAPVSEKIVGVVFVGEGDLSVRFPERADAWSFSNHMSRFAGKSKEEMALIANQQQDYKVGIEQGLILSADPRVSKLIYNLEPAGGGIFFSEKEDGGADATYIVTEKKGRFRAKMVGTNILADRSDALQRLGLDPRAMLRQDRLLGEELGFPGHYLRAVGEYKTKDRYHIAGQGTAVSSMDYDKWMSCYRDGRDEAGVGYRAMAFTHGTDLDKRRHFQRFSGLKFMTANKNELPKPQMRMEAVNADATVEFRDTKDRLSQQVTVDALLTFEAQGTNLQYLPLRLPTGGAERGSWVLDEFTLEDGSPLAWVGMHADLSDTGNNLRKSRVPLQDSDISNEAIGAEEQDSLSSNNPLANLGLDEESGGSTGQGDASGFGGADTEDLQSSSRIEGPEAPASFRLGQTDQSVAQSERTVNSNAEYSYDIIALLPKVVKKGEKVTIHLKWTAEWSFANFALAGSSARTLGATTGVHAIFPEVLPLAGGTRWDFKIKAGTKPPMFRPENLVSSGDTIRVWQDEGLWNWVESTGTQALSPSLGVGRWEVHKEEPAKGMPAVSVNLFPNTFSKAKMFGPEVRRVLVFFQGFLPGYDQSEVDVFQDRSLLLGEALRMSRLDTQYGLIKIQTISSSAVGVTSDLRDEDSKRAQTQIARQLAGQYWGQRVAPNNETDTWITTVLSDAYAAYYIRAAFGQEEHEKRMLGVREILENPKEKDGTWKKLDAETRTYSPAGATRLSDVPQKFRSDYAFFVISEMLRLQIGNQAYFSALENLSSLDRVNTDTFQRVFEESAKQSLDDFFDYWVYGGYIPKIEASIRHGEDESFLCVTTDIPFGTMEIPVRIQMPDKSIDAVISIKGGEGSAVLPNIPKSTKVTIDPLNLLLAFERDVTKTQGRSSCSDDPFKRKKPE